MRPKRKDDKLCKQDEFVRPSEDRRPVKRVRRFEATRNDKSNDEQSYEGVRWGMPGVAVFDLPETTKPQKVDEAQITRELENLVDRAKANGASEEFSKKLRTVVYMYRDVWRTRMSGEPQAKLKPMGVKLRPGVLPAQTRQRKLTKQAAKFVTDTVRELIDANITFHNPSSEWARQAMAAPKGDVGTFRLVCDLRAANAAIKSPAQSLPNMNTMLAALVGSSFFASFDFIGVYWQCLASRQASEVFSLQTPLGIVSSNHIIQGSSPATCHFSAVLIDAFRDLFGQLDCVD
jgi:hypothetical protein